MELADTSVWGRRKHPALASWFENELDAGKLAMCEMLALELLHTASTRRLYGLLADDLLGLPWLHMENWEWRRAMEVYGALAVQGEQRHRSVKHPDLLIAACAERHGVTLVHYDQDYDTIAAVTGQSVRWAAPRGSL